MMGRRGLFLLAWACLTLLATGPAAAGERMTIDAEDVPFNELLKMLERESGFELRIIDGGQGADARVAVKAENRPVKEILRSACQQAGYTYQRSWGSQFYIRKGEFKESPFAARVGPYRVSLEQLTVSGLSHHGHFSEGQTAFRVSQPRMSFSLNVEGDTSDDGRLVRSLEKLALADQKGDAVALDENVAASIRQRFAYSHGNMPDRYQIHFSAPPPTGATSLTMTGIIEVYEKLEPVEVRFDDLAAKNVTKKHENIEVNLEEAKIQGRSCNLRLRFNGLPRVRHGEPNEWTPAEIVLLGEDGREARTQTGYFTGSGSFGMTVPEGMKPVALAWRTARRIGPVRELSFKIENIPLPGQEQDADKPVAAPAPAPVNVERLIIPAPGVRF